MSGPRSATSSTPATPGSTTRYGAWLWPGGDRGLAARVVLLGLNCFAIAMTPLAVSQLDDGYGYEWDQGYQQGLSEARVPAGYASGEGDGGLVLDGKPVTNIYPYDSQGRRMAGVQLFDQEGRPVNVSGEAVCPEGDDIGKEETEGADGWACVDYMGGDRVPGFVFYAWTNGQAQLKNVFPLAGRTQEALEPSPTAFQEAEKPTLGEWPFAEVPRVSLPGITSGILDAEPGKPPVKPAD